MAVILFNDAEPIHFRQKTHVKPGENCSGGFREEDIKITVLYMYIAQEQTSEFYYFSQSL